MAVQSVFPGDPNAHTWESEPSYRERNGGWGLCNTGSGKHMRCCLGGAGCDVDHVTIKRQRDIEGIARRIERCKPHGALADSPRIWGAF